MSGPDVENYLPIPYFIRDKDNLIQEQQEAIRELVEALRDFSEVYTQGKEIPNGAYPNAAKLVAKHGDK